MDAARIDTTRLYESYRPLLFSIAYRLTGTVTDAEDLVQETFLAWAERENKDAVADVKAYLCRILSNLYADRARALAKEREQYTGPWLPEPWVEGACAVEDACVRKETITTAYLLLLEQLNPIERTVFVLREAFGFGYEEIAAITGKSVVNCRQIFHRARRGMPAHPETAAPNPGRLAALNKLVLQFARSLEVGDAQKALELLTVDAKLLTDGGGKVRAALRPIHSAERVVAFLAGVSARLPAGLTREIGTVNGLPGYVFKMGPAVVYVVSLSFEGERISGLYLTANPDKLAHLPPLERPAGKFAGAN